MPGLSGSQVGGCQFVGVRLGDGAVEGCATHVPLHFIGWVQESTVDGEHKSRGRGQLPDDQYPRVPPIGVAPTQDLLLLVPLGAVV